MSRYHKDSRIGQYSLVQLLSEGQHAELWTALTSDHRIVCLKIFKDEYAHLAEKEICAFQGLSHKSILSPVKVIEEPGSVMLEMPYCSGRSVDVLSGSVSHERIWVLLRDISSALSYMHSMGRAHLAVNPSHILWDGESFILTGCGSENTYQFEAPEASATASASADIWSLGASVFQLYMGCSVFNGLGGKGQSAVDSYDTDPHSYDIDPLGSMQFHGVFLLAC